MIRVHYLLRNSDLETIDERVTTFDNAEAMYAWEQGIEDLNPSTFLHKQSLEIIDEASDAK